MMYLGEQMIVPKESGNVRNASHWQNLLGTPEIGIMNPTISINLPQEGKVVKRTDLAVLDALGYDINTDFVNASPPLMSEEILRELLGKPHGLGPVLEMGPPRMPFSSGIFIHPNLINITGEGL